MIVSEMFVSKMTLSIKWLCRWNNRRRNICQWNDPVGEVIVSEMNVGRTYVSEMNAFPYLLTPFRYFSNYIFLSCSKLSPILTSLNSNISLLPRPSKWLYGTWLLPIGKLNWRNPPMHPTLYRYRIVASPFSEFFVITKCFGCHLSMDHYEMDGTCEISFFTLLNNPD